jgi:membrane associated rhomboid family serine protease
MAVHTPDGGPLEPAGPSSSQVSDAPPQAATPPGAVLDLDPELLRAADFFARLNQRKPFVTWGLLGSIAVMFLLEHLWGAPTQTATLVRMGAEVPSRIRDGEWWRLLAPTFLHSGWPHFLMNSFVLFSLGPFLERLLGSARFLILYVVSGLLGSLFGTLFAKLSGHSLSVGASGALFGLLGATAVLGFFPRGQIPQVLVAELKRNAVINLGLNVVNSLRPNIDFLAHLGGAVAGFIILGLGLLSPTVWPRLDGRPHGVRLARLLAVVAGGVLAASLMVALAQGRPWLLTQPLTLIRTPLPQTGLSLDLPTLTGPPRAEKRTDGAVELSVGDMLDAPLVLSLIIKPIEGISDDPKEQQQIFAETLSSLQEFSPAPDATRLQEPQQIDVGGQPALDLRFKFKNGVLYQRLYAVRERHFVVIELVTPASLPKNLQLDLAKVLLSLRREPATGSTPPEPPHG